MTKFLFSKGNQWRIKRGQHLSSFTEFKKGQHISPATEFRKGNIPWCKDKKIIRSEEATNNIRKALEGKRSRHWKGGRRKKSSGYIMIYQPRHPFATKQGYICEHRLVIEKYLNRYLTENELVHHINEIKDDNRLENLYLFPDKTNHCAYHHLLRSCPEMVVKITKSNLID